jgi:hypothetical protein
MASITTYTPGMLRPERVELYGSFETNGSSNPIAIKGFGYTVVHSATGKYTVTLSDSYADVEFAEAHLQMHTPDGSVATVGDISVSGRTIVIETLTDGSAADIAANANNRVNFRLVLRNTSIAY